MKNTVFSLVMCVAAAGIGYGTAHAYFNKEKASLNEQMAQLKVDMQTANSNRQAAESIAKTSEEKLIEVTSKLVMTEDALAQAKSEREVILKERDQLKASLVLAENMKSKTANKAAPITTPETNPENPTDALQPGAPGLPAGISKGGGGAIKRPGQ